MARTPSFSTQRVSRRQSGSCSEEGQREGVGKGSHQQGPRHNAAGQSSSVAVPKQRVPLSPDQVVEAARSRVAKLQASACHAGRGRRHVPCCPGSTFEGRVPSTRTACVRAHPVDNKFCRKETKASRTGQGSNRESARGSKFGHGFPEGGGKFVRRWRTEARGVDDRGEGCSVSIPSHSSLQRQRRVGASQGRDLQIAAAAGWDPSCCAHRGRCQSQSPWNAKNWAQVTIRFDPPPPPPKSWSPPPLLPPPKKCQSEAPPPPKCL